MKCLLHTFIATFIIYYVVFKYLLICLASLDFQLHDAQGFVYSVEFHFPDIESSLLVGFNVYVISVQVH